MRTLQLREFAHEMRSDEAGCADQENPGQAVPVYAFRDASDPYL